MTHRVRLGSLAPRGRGDLESNPEPKHAVANCSQTVNLMLLPGEYKRIDSDSAFCQIFFILSCSHMCDHDDWYRWLQGRRPHPDKKVGGITR